jgi:hypothetical protein
MTASQQPKTSTALTGGTILVTNALKVLGGYLVYLEQQGQGRTSVLLAAVALALGAQAVENVLLRAIDKFFARE